MNSRFKCQPHLSPEWMPGRSRYARFFCGLLAPTICLALAGCGANSDLLEVGGNVSLNGVPLKSGSIRFTLMNNEKAVSAEPGIIDGRYATASGKGLPPGTYHVMISAVDENSPMVTVRDALGRPVTSAPADLIPAEYNTSSDKTVDVTPEGENQFNFDIVK